MKLGWDLLIGEQRPWNESLHPQDWNNLQSLNKWAHFSSSLSNNSKLKTKPKCTGGKNREQWMTRIQFDMIFYHSSGCNLSSLRMPYGVNPVYLCIITLREQKSLDTYITMASLRKRSWNNTWCLTYTSTVHILFDMSESLMGKQDLIPIPLSCWKYLLTIAVLYLLKHISAFNSDDWNLSLLVTLWSTPRVKEYRSFWNLFKWRCESNTVGLCVRCLHITVSI